ncbi:acyltransferase family protein [Granulicella aggregans]|uniref:acyltransferase family protein n=1 Tax=Granulicella aggregans TaxID=474949 RepID=UPI0021E08205|nr:acyltransferase [Granulicella aggregans]
MGLSSTTAKPELSTSAPGGFAHIPQLDGVRGLAILLILIHHSLSSNPQTNSRVIAFFIAIRESMWVGVDLFFALSGFLITGILFDSLSGSHFLRNFYGRRAVRIFPLYYLALFMVWLMGLPIAMHWSGYEWVLIAYLDNTRLWIGHAVPHPLVDLTGHLWSLALEEQFYLVWPLLVLLLRDRRRLIVTALALSVVALGLRCVLVAHGTPEEITYKMLPCRLDGLLLGGVLALAIRGPRRELWLRRAPIVFLISSGILLLVAIREHGIDWQHSRFINSVGYTLTALASTALIAMTLSSGSRLAHTFRQSWLRWFGRYSYGIYVWHMIVPFLVVPPLHSALSMHLHNKLLLLLANAVAGATVSIAVSVLSYQAFEVHFLRLKRFFAYRGLRAQ